MSNARYPWQILAIAAISIVGNFYLGYYLLFGLAGAGVDVSDKTGRVEVTSLWAPPAERAGLAVGDVLKEVNGQHIGTEVDWLAQHMNFEPDKPIAIRVERAGQPVDLQMFIHGRVWDQLDRATKTSQIIFLANKFITLVIGLFVVFSRPKNLVARIGGWALVAMASVYEPFPGGMSASLRGLPSVLAIAVMLVYVSAAIRTALLAGFFCLFPKTLITKRWIWTAVVAVPLLATIYSLQLLGRTVYDPAHLSGFAPKWVLTGFAVQSLLYLVLALVVIPINFWRLELVTDRRRFRVVSYGALLGMIFYLPRVIESAAFQTNSVMTQFWESPTATLVSNLGVLIFPFSFAYAILRQRLFDVRVIIRRVLQYAMARRFLLAIPMMAAGL